MSENHSPDTLAIVTDLARQRFGWTGVVDAETRLVEDLGLDSLKALEMIIEIENRFEIRIDESSESGIVTVADLVAVIDRAVATDSESAE